MPGVIEFILWKHIYKGGNSLDDMIILSLTQANSETGASFDVANIKLNKDMAENEAIKNGIEDQIVDMRGDIDNLKFGLYSIDNINSIVDNIM